MLRVKSALKGYTIEATNGKVGSVSDLLFDDLSWKIRWLVVDTGGWLGGRKVLIHPSAIDQPDDILRQLPVKLMKEQLNNSPDILEDQPVSRQMEESLYGYYGWDPLWGGQCFAGGAIASPLVPPPLFGGTALREPAGVQADQEGQDPHLRSVAAVTGYRIRGTDGEIGHLKSFLVDDESWTIRYLVIDTSNWWFGDNVLLAPIAVTDIDWSSSQIRLNVTRDQVKASPAFQPDATIPQEYEHRLRRGSLGPPGPRPLQATPSRRSSSRDQSGGLRTACPDLKTRSSPLQEGQED